MRVSGGTLLTVVLLAVLVHPNLVASGAASGTGAVLLALAIGLSVIASVLLHEVAHALAARAFGGQVDHIALTLWGGHTQYRARSAATVPSIVISLVGPATNALIALAARALAPDAAQHPALAACCFYIATLNLGLAVFNLLPGLPMDGGRAVEALLGAVLRDRSLGTIATAWIGRAIAIVIIAVPLLRMLRGADGLDALLLIWTLLIAGTLWQGATSALRGATARHRARRLEPARLARPVRLLRADGPVSMLDPALDHPAGHGEAAVIVVGEGGTAHRPDPGACAAVPAALRASTPLSAVSLPLGPLVTLRVDADGEQAAALLSARPDAVCVLVDAAGAPVGLLEAADLASALRLSSRPRTA